MACELAGVDDEAVEDDAKRALGPVGGAFPVICEACQAGRSRMENECGRKMGDWERNPLARVASDLLPSTTTIHLTFLYSNTTIHASTTLHSGRFEYPITVLIVVCCSTAATTSHGSWLQLEPAESLFSIPRFHSQAQQNRKINP